MCGRIVDVYGPNYLPRNRFSYKSKKDAQDAHEAIRPTFVGRTPEISTVRLIVDRRVHLVGSDASR